MNIRFYILRRIALLVPTLLGLSILTFSIARIVPGDPVGLAAGPQAPPKKSRKPSGASSALISLCPFSIINYMAGLFRGDWGESLYTRRPVIDDFARLLARHTRTDHGRRHHRDDSRRVPAGVISAMYRNRLPDHVARVLVACFSSAFPSFWLAMIFQTWFGRDLGLVPHRQADYRYWSRHLSCHDRFVS